MDWVQFILERKKRNTQNRKLMFICGIVFLLAVGILSKNYYLEWKDDETLKKQREALTNEKAVALQREETESLEAESLETVEETEYIPVMLPEYEELYEQNHDLIGWLKIEDTVIDYPVMQTSEDETYYLDLDFNGRPNKNGCLILDTDSQSGIGTKETEYQNGVAPSTNLIIHGHTMKSGQMFGDLDLYRDAEYGREHPVIYYDSLYEKREYELIAVFYSQVYYENQDVFKYYKFFQADTQEEFDDWYNNIKALSLYDTGVTAEFGDEFLTLSCCAYHVEDGRFVVVAKRMV